MATINGTSIIAFAEDGTPHDITEGVEALYDHLINSMDWGSEFLSLEDAIPIAELAERCGFKETEAAQRYVKRARGV